MTFICARRGLYAGKPRLPNPFTLLGTIDNANYKSVVYLATGPVTGRIYAGCGASARDTLIVIDPATRTVLGSLTDTTNLAGIDDIKLTPDETTAFVSCENMRRGVSSVNVTNPAAMSIRQTLFTGSGSGPHYGYAASALEIDYTNKLLLVPTLTYASVSLVDWSAGVASMAYVAPGYRGDTAGTSLLNCRRAAAWPAKTLGFFGTDNGNTHCGAFSYATPSAPTKIWQITNTDDPTHKFFQVRGVYLDLDTAGSERLYLCHTGASQTVLSIWDISQMPTTPTPTLLGTYQATGPVAAFNTPRSLLLHKSGARTYCILTGESGRLMLLLDVTDPTLISLFGYTSDPTALNQCMGVVVDDSGNVWTGNFASNGQSVRGLSAWSVVWPS